VPLEQAVSPVNVHHFRLTLAGRDVGGLFRECSGLASETEVIEHRAGDDAGQPFVRKLPGATRWSSITLTRGVDDNRDLWEWRDAVHKGGADAARTDGTIELIDHEGTSIATYAFRQGWPAKYQAAFSATGNVAVEAIEICVEAIERV
jgi:phage tail-like protein